MWFDLHKCMEKHNHRDTECAITSCKDCPHVKDFELRDPCEGCGDGIDRYAESCEVCTYLPAEVTTEE